LPEELAGDVEARRVRDLASSEELDLHGVDAIVHLAARVHVMREAAADPLAEHRRLNTEATLRLARSAARQGVKRFVFMSTVKVNGERTVGASAFSERDAPAPSDPYAVSKWEAEQGLAGLAAASALETVSLRPPLVYGPGVKGNFLRLLQLVNLRLPLPLASVANARSLIYVGNLAAAVERAASAPAPVRGSYLVSDGVHLSTPQLVRMLGAALGKPARLVPFPPALLRTLAAALGKSDEVARVIESLRVDSSGFTQKFQWVAPFTVEQGVKETAGWFARRDRLDVSRSLRFLR
jgi:nucleoside-diphosphate-sugar epimerase